MNVDTDLWVQIMLGCNTYGPNLNRHPHHGVVRKIKIVSIEMEDVIKLTNRFASFDERFVKE